MVRKKKIGIITYHKVLNFGAYCQLYALSSFLNKNYRTEVVNFKSFGFYIKEFRSLFSKNMVKNFYQFLNYIFFIFYRKKLNFSKIYFKEKNINYKKYDMLIYGSDEIWNFENPIIKFQNFYYGANVETPKISFSVSFGNVDLNNKRINKIKKYINQFSYISVRDINSKKIINKISNKHVSLTLDPVFLYDFKKEMKIYVREKFKNIKNYLVVYGFYFNPLVQKNILSFAKKNKINIISVGYHNNWAENNFCLVNPFELIFLIKKANYVFTNMFHGCVFAIKFGKKLILEKDLYRVNKLDALRKNFNLKYLNPKLNKIDEFINFTNRKKFQLKKNTVFSKNYLIKSIN